MPSERENLLNLYRTNIPLYEKMTESIQEILTNVAEQENIECALPIQARTKDVSSFLEKVDRKKYQDPFLEMTDITGSRVVLYTDDEVRFMKDIIEERFAVDYDKSVDKKEKLLPSQFGYAGVNYVVSFRDDHPILSEHPEFKGKLFEIQILTLCQMSWEEMQRKIEYKAEDFVSILVSRRLLMLCALFELADVELQYLIKKGIEELLGQPISLRSLRIYLKKSESIHSAMSVGLKNGIFTKALPEEDLGFLDELYDACTIIGLKTLLELDTTTSNKDLVSHLFKSMKDHGTNIRAGPITMALLLLYHSNNKVDEKFLLERNWNKETVEFIIDRN